MTLVVIGRDEEVTGFALAGVTTLVCNSPGDAGQAIDRVAAPGSGCGLVLVTPWIARHAARALDSARQRKGPPVVAVIPGDGP